MLDTTGSLTQFTSTENLEVLLPLVSNPEVLTRVTDTPRPRLVVVTPGRSTTPYPYGDTDLRLVNNLFKNVLVFFFARLRM